MKRILDYEEMKELLDSLINIKKCDPIGYSNFGYPIDHYSYGHGNNHVIITGGTHSAELITNIFVIRFMEKISKSEIFIDPNIYTIHFIPFVNPEGTIIVTKTIRSLISRDMSEDVVQTYCLDYYRNSYIEGEYASKFGDKNIKLQHWMFRYAEPSLLDGELGKSVSKIIKDNDLPRGCMINWSSNGRGVDLNSNIEGSSYIDRVVSGEQIYEKLHLNTIKRNNLGPVGCPYYSTPGEIEPENVALLNFYNEIKNNYNLIGSFIYHSCGGLVYYLGDASDKNPWASVKEDDVNNNKLIADMYASEAKYVAYGSDIYTTMDCKLKSLFPVTLLIELGEVRATPLSQFLDLDLPGSNEKFKNVYTKIIENNTKAILRVLPNMVKISKR